MSELQILQYRDTIPWLQPRALLPYVFTMEMLYFGFEAPDRQASKDTLATISTIHAAWHVM